MSNFKDIPILMKKPETQSAWFSWGRALSDWFARSVGGTTNIRAVSDGTTTELVLYSSQSSSPYANTFIRFREPDGTGKAVMGFTASGDNTFSITSYEDFRLKFRTGKVGDPTDFTNRVSIHGNATSSWLTIVSANDATEVGGCYLRFTETDDSVPKGYVGYASTTDDDLDIINGVSGSNITLQVTGAGYIIPNVPITFPVGGSGVPSITFAGDTDTGFYHPAANTVALAIGSDRVTWTTSSVTVNLQNLGQDGTVSLPGYSFSSNTDTGFYRSATNRIQVVTGGVARFEAKANGQMRFVPLSADPAGLEDGDVWFNSTAGKLRFRVGGVTVDLN